MNEAQFHRELSRSEALVYEYIKSASIERGGFIQEPLKYIAGKLQLSDATVHRAIRKLNSRCVIGVMPPEMKSESNRIIYYGLDDEAGQVEQITELASSLNERIKRFHRLLHMKDRKIEELSLLNETLYEELLQLRQKTLV
jgi:hypothetical protein